MFRLLCIIHIQAFVLDKLICYNIHYNKGHFNNDPIVI